MSGPSTYKPTTAFGKWMHERLPIYAMVKESALDFPTPKNLNYFWTFGGILAIMLVAQILTGIILVMHYTPHVDMAFNASKEHIVRNVNYGWMIQKFHEVGASMFFIAVYIHMFRGLYYGSYKAPREVLWMLGVRDLPADDGHRLHGLRPALGPDELLGRQGDHQPVLGPADRGSARASTWLWGGFAVDNPTLNRFFSLHYLLPFVIAGVVILHIWALHVVRARTTRPAWSRSRRAEQDTVPFHPVLHGEGRLRDERLPAVLRLLGLLPPNALGHADNYEPGQPAGDARAHRSGMVLPAVLRDPARRAGRSWVACWPCSVRSADPVRAAVA